MEGKKIANIVEDSGKESEYEAEKAISCAPASTQPVKEKGRDLAIASLICGIIGFFVCGSGIAAIALAVLAKKDGNTSSMRTAGFVLGIISTAFIALCIIVYIVFVAAMFVNAGEISAVDIALTQK